jgi:hypothetical protein
MPVVVVVRPRQPLEARSSARSPRVVSSSRNTPYASVDSEPRAARATNTGSRWW